MGGRTQGVARSRGSVASAFVRTRLAWLVGLAGLLVLLRRWRLRAAGVEQSAAEVAGAESPAEELRRKLDDSRDDPPAEEPSPVPAADVDDRRRQAHDAGRAAVDEMDAGPKPED